jgi:hypothetical protein
LVSGIVTEVGILRNPTSHAIESAFKQAGLEVPDLLGNTAVKGSSALR